MFFEFELCRESIVLGLWANGEFGLVCSKQSGGLIVLCWGGALAEAFYPLAMKDPFLS